MFRLRVCFCCFLLSLSYVMAQNPTDTLEVINSQELEGWFDKYSIQDTVNQAPIDTPIVKIQALTNDSIASKNGALDQPIINKSMSSSTPLVDYETYLKTIAFNTQLQLQNKRLQEDSVFLMQQLSAQKVSLDSLEKLMHYYQLKERHFKDSLKWVNYKRDRWGSDYDSLANNRFINQSIAPKYLLSIADSLRFHREAIGQSEHNALFLDWVFGQATDSISPKKEEEYAFWKLHQKVRQDLLAENVALFRYHRDEMPTYEEINPSSEKSLKRENIQLKIGDNSQFDETTVHKFDGRPRWKYGGLGQLHTSQNYISENWYKGGESHLNFNARIKYELNYSNYKNIQWDNSVEYKQNLMSAGSDTLRSMRLNEDQLQLQSKLSRRAFKKFYYTGEMRVTMPLFNMYEANTNVRTAAFASPVRAYWSLGVDYKKDKILSVFVSPLSYKVVYVNDTSVAKGVDVASSLARKYSIPMGQKASHQLGLLARINYKHKLMTNVHLEHKFYSYINYVGEKKGVEFDYELLASFQINQFLTSEITLHPRYDTLIEIPDGESAFQFKEVISLGFSYRF